MIEFDRNFGIDKATGWSVPHRGSYLAVLEPHLIIAIVKSAWLWIRYYGN